MEKTKENNQNTLWTTVGVVMCLVILFLIGFGAKIGTYEREVVNVPVNYDTGNEYNGQIQTVAITGIDEIKTVNNANTINLIISGTDNKVTVTKNTKISSLSLTGIDNIVNLCNGFHNPEVIQSGIGNKVNYLNC